MGGLELEGVWEADREVRVGGLFPIAPFGQSACVWGEGGGWGDSWAL